MTKILISALVCASAVLVPAAAQAQSGGDPTVEPFVGVSAGYHDLGASPSEFKNEETAIFGVVGGVDTIGFDTTRATGAVVFGF